MTAIDTISSELAGRGWSVGDLAVHGGDCAVWQVFGQYNEQRVLARAPNQTTAWTLAAIQILDVRRRALLERSEAIEREFEESGEHELNNPRLLDETDEIEFELGRDYIFRRDCLS